MLIFARERIHLQHFLASEMHREIGEGTSPQIETALYAGS